MDRIQAAWVRRLEFPKWSFENPRQQIIKFCVDIRPPHTKLQREGFRNTGGASNLLQHLSCSVSQGILAEQEPRQGGSNISAPGLPRGRDQQANKPPLFSQFHEHIHHFGSQHGGYFGGPLIDISTFKWQETYYTRGNGNVIGTNLRLPPGIERIVRSTAVMKSLDKFQSGIWVGPRLLLSTLHLCDWAGGNPSIFELERIWSSGQTFEVEYEISSKVMSEYSLKVQLVGFCASNDIGIYQLQTGYPSRVDFVDPDLLLERDEFYRLHPQLRERVACVGFSGSIDATEAVLIRQEAQIQVQQRLQRSACLIPPLDLDLVTKPGMKSFSPGTIDKGVAKGDHVLFGVSCPLWRGSSGGPCIGLEGTIGGVIIGLVQGFDGLPTPYNLVNGFPNGLKDALRGFSSKSGWIGLKGK